MGELRPLAGKRVVVTRAAEQSAELVQRLEGLGATVLLLPAVRFEAAADSEPLNRALANLASFDWIFFTSQNAVTFFTAARKATKVGSGTSAAPFPKTAAVGKVTAAELCEAGINVDFVASRYDGLSLAEELGGRLKGCKVLLPRSDRARGDLPEALRRAGAHVTEVVAYRTVNAEMGSSDVLEEIRRGRVDVVTFASPSALHAVAEAAGAEALLGVAGRPVLAALGPVTAEAIRAAGLAVEIVALESTATGLAAAIGEYFQRQSVSLGVTSR